MLTSIRVSCRYFPLLAKQKPDHPECCILLNVFALLSAKNASPVTVAMVMDIAETLATAEDFVASEAESELSVHGCVFAVTSEGFPFHAHCCISSDSRLRLIHAASQR